MVESPLSYSSKELLCLMAPVSSRLEGLALAWRYTSSFGGLSSFQLSNVGASFTIRGAEAPNGEI